MQVINTAYATTATLSRKTSPQLTPTNRQDVRPSPDKPTIRDLAKTIDPSNMSRNEARAIANALALEGGLAIDNPFITQSMILVRENGQLRNATEDDAIMHEKFNMLHALQSQIEFNQSNHLSTASLEKGLAFLENFNLLGTHPEVNIYA